jgi:outer membrane protein assembly factor BamB
MKRKFSVARALFDGAAGAIALGALAACSPSAAPPGGSMAVPSSVWPMYQYRPDHNAVFQSPSWKYRWKARLDGKINGALSIVGDTLYLDTIGGSIYALDPKSGSVRWRTRLSNMAMNAPIVAENLVVVGTGSSDHLTDLPDFPIVGQPQGDEIVAVAKNNGRIAWKFHTVGENMPTGAYVRKGDRSYFVFENGDGHSYGLDFATGSLAWKTHLPGTSWMSSLAFDGERVYGIASDASISYYNRAVQTGRFESLKGRTWAYALRPETGQILWLTPHGNADASPTSGDGKVFTEDDYPADTQGHLVTNTVQAIDAATGRLLWQYKAPPGAASGYGTAESSIAGLYHAGILYQSLPWHSHFVAFNASNGRILWDVKTHDAVKMSAVLKDGLLYVGDTSGYLYVIRAKDGAVLRSTKFPAIFTCSPPVIVGDTLFIANKSTLYALPLDDVHSGNVKVSASSVPAD